MVFEILAIFGLCGLGLMALLGSVRFGHHAAGGLRHGGGHAHTALPTHQGQLAGLKTHGGHAPAHGAKVQPAPQAAQEQNAPVAAPITALHARHFNLWWLVISPMDIFSLCFGAGIAGMLFQGHVAARFLTLIAVLGAVVFCFAIERPLASIVLRFAANPSEGLEGTLALTAEAITNFDHFGQGLVCVNMEGQLVQLLGKLSSEELSNGGQVLKGQQVVITEVDSKRGTCTVTRELSL